MATQQINERLSAAEAQPDAAKKRVQNQAIAEAIYEIVPGGKNIFHPSDRYGAMPQRVNQHEAIRQIKEKLDDHNVVWLELSSETEQKLTEANVRYELIPGKIFISLESAENREYFAAFIQGLYHKQYRDLFNQTVAAAQEKLIGIHEECSSKVEAFSQALGIPVSQKVRLGLEDAKKSSSLGDKLLDEKSGWVR